MTPSLVVLTDFLAVSNRALDYAAALAVPLGGHLVLLHVPHDGLLAPEEYGHRHSRSAERQTEHELLKLAAAQPVPAEVDVSEQFLPDAVQEAVRRTQPLLLAMGLSTEHDALDHVLHNQALPVLRGTHRPLLLVPELAPAAQLPRRVLLALDAESFVPNAATRDLAPLLAAWPASYTVSHVLGLHEQEAFPGQRVLHHLHLSRLLPPT
ncbi:universal stress protein, partial [Hymenobacter persicinus]